MAILRHQWCGFLHQRHAVIAGGEDVTGIPIGNAGKRADRDAETDCSVVMDAETDAARQHNPGGFNGRRCQPCLSLNVSSAVSKP